MKNLDAYIKRGGFYEAVVEDGSDIIFLVDFSGNILYHNHSVKETLGYRGKSLVGKNFLDFILPSTLEEFKTNFKLSQKRAYTEKVEFQFLCKDKTYRFLEFNAINLKNKEGLSGFILDCRDITQRKRDAAELLRLQKAKEQFLANMSHEIRTPINGIAGIAGLLSQEHTKEEREMYLNAIRHSAENLKVIINDILDLSAIESGKLKFEKIAFNLTDLIPTLISTFTFQAREKKIDLSYKIEPKLNTILIGDPVRLNQILINLIGNAVKFTHTGSIDVLCEVEKEQKQTYWVRITVRDTGVGIPPDKLATIFESFSQADESVTRRYGGTGLGLAICKQLAELQNGHIEVESKEHIGSTFTVHIPYPVDKNNRVMKAQLEKKSKKLEGLSRSVKVLLVEDNDINRLYATSILKNWKCKVDVAENGLIALEKLKNKNFDVVLMDVQMPVMDGYDATKALRKMDEPTNKVPVVALTANATKIDIDRCLAAGMDDYLSKPFTPEDLYRKLFDELKIVPVEKGPMPEPESTEAVAPHFDLSYLRSVSGNNEEFIKEMVETFVQSLPVSLKEINDSLIQGDNTKLARVIHQIKPSLSLLGLNQLRDEAMAIEDDLKTTPLPDKDISEMLSVFVSKCTKEVRALEAELGRL
jgi:PAS domain S-box-containing protein